MNNELVFEGRISELHVYPDECTGILVLVSEGSMLRGYPTIPFKAIESSNIDIIRKSNGKLRLAGHVCNIGDSTFEDAKLVLEVSKVEET